MKHTLLFLGIISISTQAMAQIKYPAVRKQPKAETFFDTTITENFRYLENLDSEVTRNWVIEQNKTTQQFLQTIPYRDQIRTRLNEVWNYEKMAAPFNKRNKLFFFKNDGMQNQSVLYVQSSMASMPTVLLDPNTLSKDGTTSLSMFSVNEDASLAVVGISKAGSDWNTFRLFDINSKKFLNEDLLNIKFSGASWYKNGFFYSRYDIEDGKQELATENKNMKVYYHKIGTSQKEDSLVYENPENPSYFISISSTKDERYLILTTSATTSGNELFIKDAKDPKAKWVPIYTGFNQDAQVLTSFEDKIYIFTNHMAPKGKIISLNLKKPEVKNTVIAEGKNVITDVHYQTNHFIVHYLENVKSKIQLYGMKGNLVKDIELPGPGIVGAINGDDGSSRTFFTFTNYLSPGIIYEMQTESGMISEYWRANVNFKAEEFETVQVFYPSKDGTQIPMFLTYKKGLKLTANNPVFLYGYGGFNISVTPSFSPAMIPFLEKGGIYAVANIRGGGEFGKEWYLAGTKLKKQNVFDDFISAAEYLIEKKYTNKEKIAICGRSNGGLLVGAAMTQRPDLFKVALPGVGVLDMLHYHQFTIGYAWANDYGRSDDKEEFEALIKYSPLHNIKKVKYPSTLVTTADHDDRVVPSHSFKFISELQLNHTGSNPVLIRVDVNAGHGAGKPTAKTIDEWTDIWAFTMQQLGMKF